MVIVMSPVDCSKSSSAIRGPLAVGRNLQSAICNLQSAICNLQSAICNLQSAICNQ